MHRPNQVFPGAPQLHSIQQPRPVGTPQQAHHATFAGQNSANASSTFQSPHLSSGVPVQHQQHYAPPHPESAYYSSHPSPHSTHSTSGQYRPSGEHHPANAQASDPMAATAHMQRPYPPIYHTPQSASRASVSSPQGHDQHGRPMYGQPNGQINQPMYTYPQYPPMSQVHQSPYATHPGQQQHAHQLTSQPMLLHQASAPQISHQQASGHPSAMSSSPRIKLDPMQQQQHPSQQQQQQHHPQHEHQQHQQSQQQQQPPPPPQQPRASMVQQHVAPSAPPATTSSVHPGQSSTAGANANAAPGPIPATTPLVVRQDGNGVQWIAFEYSRDRTKLEYTIRCDVESVNVDGLSQDFKNENCVYPRACCSKESYKGNRLNYETECNQVGWALAELNACLRSKRGLIQRAVDSWRNSNQDPRLRSRRVRRQAKMNNRTKAAAQHPSHMPAPSNPGPAGIPGGNTSMAAPGPRAPGPMSTGGPQLHHHHAHPDGSAPGQEDVSATADYSNDPQAQRQTQSNLQGTAQADARQGQMFGGYPVYPTVTTAGAPSMAPPTRDSMNHLGRHEGTNTMVSTVKDEKEEQDATLFGDVPEGKRRKFILVEDTQRNNRVRVKVMLDEVEMSEIPDSFRKINSVYPRSYFPVQMQSPPSSSRGNRFVEDDDAAEDDGAPTVSRTTVPVQMLDGEGEVAVPKITRSKRTKEQRLNELGYRMAWSQSRVFAGRTIFLQRALDAYRNKQRSTLITAGQEVSAIPPHLATRIGKRRWIERSGRDPKRSPTPPTTNSE